MPGYQGGHILRIKVENFMTYKEMELFPRHGLNLIIGLNGSGKSSIMCAICLGLGGKPQNTGRSVQLSDFIKYGCDKATIEIELHDPELGKRNVVIKRIIVGNKTTWLLNKSLASDQEIQNTVKNFNIDVSNLCQFLPQEKVTEFSKMDKKQRLENMLQSIGEPQLYNLYKELKQMKTESLKIEEEITGHKSHIEYESEITSRLKPQVDMYEEKTRMEEHLKSYKEHKVFCEYREIRDEIMELKAGRKPLIKEEDKLNSIIAKINQEKEEKSTILSNVSEHMQELKLKLDDLQNSITRKVKEFVSLYEQAENEKIHYQNQIEERRNQKLRLEKLESQIEDIKDLYRKDLDLKPKIEARNRDVELCLEKIKLDTNVLVPNQDFATVEKNNFEDNILEILFKIENLKNVENKKLDLLRQQSKDVYEAVIWLQENKQQFKAPVHLPMFLLLKVANDENLKYIENVIRKMDFLAFLCEDKEDTKLLTRILRQEKNLQVHIVMVPGNPIESYQSPSLSLEFRQLGIQCFLKDIVDAPDAVMRFLCHCCEIHMIPLCVSSAEKHVDIILKEFNVFITPDAMFQRKISKYSKNICIKRDFVERHNFLPSSSDNSDQLHLLQTQFQEEQRKMNMLNNKLQKIQEEMTESEREANSLREEKRKIEEKLLDIVKTERHLKLKEQSYERRKNELINEEAAKIKVAYEIRQINTAKIIKCAEIIEYLQEFIPLKIKKLEYKLQARLTHKYVGNFEKLLEEKEAEKRAINERLVELTRKILELKSKGQPILAQVKQHVPTDKMTQEQQVKFNNLNGMSTEHMLLEIRRMEAVLALYDEENHEVITEYNERTERIKVFEREIVNCENKLRHLQGKINEKKGTFLPALKAIINNINSKFSEYYHQLNCTGEISLDDCQESDDFLNYGLQIILKYRDNEPLMELSNAHHSGGECSVAAIIFILSLQELAEVPFRCIDEINQGMDSQNERNIYNLIADSSKNGSSSQYFLLTPKLLMDLEMTENKEVAVHIIFNSLHLDMKLDVRKHIELAEKI